MSSGMLLPCILGVVAISNLAGVAATGLLQAARFNVGLVNHLHQFIPVVDKGQRLPAKSAGKWWTDEAGMARFRIVQGQHQTAWNNQEVGRLMCVVDTAKSTTINFTTVFDVRGLLTLIAEDPSSGVTQTLTLHPEEHFHKTVARATETCDAAERRMAEVERSQFVLSSPTFQRLYATRRNVDLLRSQLEKEIDDPKALEDSTRGLEFDAWTLEESLWSDVAGAAAVLCNEAQAHLTAVSTRDVPRVVWPAIHDAGDLVGLLRRNMTMTMSETSMSLVEAQQFTEALHAAMTKLQKAYHVLEYFRTFDNSTVASDSCDTSASATASRGAEFDPSTMSASATASHGAEFDVIVAEVTQRMLALRAKRADGVQMEEEVELMTQDVARLVQKLALQVLNAAATITAAA